AVGIAACGDDDSSTSGDTTATDAGSADLGLTKDGTLTAGSDIPFPPFEQGDPPDYEGFDIDLINDLAGRLGLETEIRDVPFFAITSGGGQGFDLGIAATTITPERERKVDFSDPYFNAEQSMLVAAGGDIKSIDDVTSDTIVGAQDGTTGETYASENTDADVRPFEQIDDAYGALERGQVDAVFNDLPSTQSVADDSGGALEVAQTFDTREEYGIVFRQEEATQALLEAVNGALQEIKDDGTLDELYQKWFQTDAPKSLLTATHEAT
ncbi:MAG: transporter substrate-binding domain-containing protein, partial [Thermoleophilia bacterium]|nr:transporter substrate-binding domain-containing protein [Thermoleophilia bacterium]